MPRKRELRSIDLKQGVSRIKGAPITSLYDATNARIRKDLRLSKLGAPSVATPDITEANKPYYEWNDYVLDNNNRGNSFTDEDGNTFQEFLSMDAFDSKLFASTRFRNVSLVDFYKIVSMDRNYDSDTDATVNISTDMPCIIDDPVATALSLDVYDGIDPGDLTIITGSKPHSVIYRSFIAVPYNAKGEAGPWRYFGGRTDMYTVQDKLTMPQHLEIVFPVNEATVRVELYSSTNQDKYGYTHAEGFSFYSMTYYDLKEANTQKDDQFYFVANIEADHDSSGNKEIRYVHATSIITDVQWAFYKSQAGIGEVDVLEYGLPPGSWTPPDAPAFKELDLIAPSYIGGVSSFPLLDLRRIYGSYKDYSPPHGYFGIGAKTMLNDGGTMLYGNVTVPTREPKENVGNWRTSTVPGFFAHVYLQFEYEDENGDPYYSNVSQLANTEILKVFWNGEKALLVFADFGGGTVLWERIEPNAEGLYQTKYKDSQGKTINDTFYYDAVQDKVLEATAFYTATLYKNFPNGVLLATAGKPREITFDTFSTPDDTEIIGIYPTRLAEQEALKSYSFFVFTDKNILIYDREGRDVVLVENMTRDLECKQNGTLPIVTNVKEGLVFVDVNNHVYFSSGRQYTRLDLELPSYFKDIKDLSYDPLENILYVLEGTHRIWMYDFDFGKWVGSYKTDNENILHTIFYSHKEQDVISLVESNESGNLFNYIYDEKGTDYTARPKTKITTQPFDATGKELYIKELQISYDKDGYHNYDKDSWATLRHSVRGDKILDPEETNGGIDLKYAISRNNSVNPTLVGRGHQFTLADFDELIDFEIIVELMD